MRMNDIEYEFTRDVIEKKVTARSARNTRTHNGKRGAVKFPSDYKTKKEIKAMSGECVTYPSLKKPMTWEEFKSLPSDLKKEYIIFIRETFGAPDKYIAAMFGINTNTLGTFLVDLKLNKGKGVGGGTTKWKKDYFYSWCEGRENNEEHPVAATLEETVCEVQQECTKQATIGFDSTPPMAIPTTGTMTFESDVAQALSTINMILGGKKAKLTITWEVYEENEQCLQTNSRSEF